MHLDDGTLRRLVDEPLAATLSQRRHYAACETCKSRYDAIAGAHRVASAALDGRAPRVDAPQAWTRLDARLCREGARPAPGWRLWLGGLRGRGGKRAAGTAAVAAALIGALTLTPAGSLAQSFVTIFEPTHVTVVPLSTADLRGLPNLSKFGTMDAPAQIKDQPASSAAEAEHLAGMHVVTPASLPGDVPSSVKYDVIPSQTASFTFSAARAQQEAAAEGKTLPPMPANIDGSTLRVTTGTAVVATYGSGSGGDLPALVVGQMTAPQVSSAGVTVSEIENYVLSLPGVSPTLAAEIRAIGDPASTLPLPIPADLAHAQPVTVQGVQGQLIGDSTGLGSMVVWQKDGIIYGVGGTLTQDQVLAVANGLS